MSPTALRRTYLGLLLFGILGPLGTSQLERGAMEAALVLLVWLAWMSLPILYALAALKSGFIQVRGWTTYRAKEPARFWVGLATLEALLATFAVLATMGLSAYFVR